MLIRLIRSFTFALPLLALGWPVAADCDPAGPPAEVLPRADVAFVGQVVDVRGPAATFIVSEVWAGDVGEAVEVRGLSERSVGRNADGVQGFTEDDRHWEVGTTYLVVPIVEGPVLRDSICTATSEWSDELAALRPADAVIAPQSSKGDSLVALPILAIAIAAAAVIAISVLAFRRPNLS